MSHSSSTFSIPFFFVYTENDKIIDIKQMKKVYISLGSENKEILDLTGAKSHMVAGDILSSEKTKPFADRIINFLNDNLFSKE